MALSPFGNIGGFGLGLPGFGMGFGGGMFDDLEGGFGGGTSVQTFSSSFGGMGGPGVGVRSSSTSTRIVNGRKVTTKKVVDNGVETVSTYENDVLRSQTVNGVAQALQGGHQGHQGSPQHRAAPRHHPVQGAQGGRRRH